MHVGAFVFWRARVKNGDPFAMLRCVRGTHDLFPSDLVRHTAIVDVFKRIATSMGYSEIRTPVLEHVAVFNRSLGLQSDIVSKEMFLIRSSEDSEVMCLRPEATAGACTASSARSVRETPRSPLCLAMSC